MTKRRGKSAKHQADPVRQPREERHPSGTIYRIKSPKVYSSYPYTSYEPVEVGTFSTDLDRNVLPCNAESFPQYSGHFNLPFDLNEGMDEYYEQKEGLDSNRVNSRLPLWQRFLKWITISNFDLSSVDFVARRGILKYIGYTLYDYHKGPWKFMVCKHDGKIYMYEPSPEKRCESIIEKDSRCKAYMYWGKKFEDMVTSSKEDTAGCYRMVRSNIGKYKVLLGSEVDAVRIRERDALDDVIIEEVLKGCPKHPILNRRRYYSGNATEFIEIKTCVKKQVKNKISFGWLQSYLAGIDTLVFGFRDNEGMIGSVEEYKVCDVPLNADWSAGAMFGLISGVLKWLHQLVDEGSSGVLEYKGGDKRDIEFTKLSDEHFLPDWFTKHLLCKENRVKICESSGSNDM